MDPRTDGLHDSVLFEAARRLREDDALRSLAECSDWVARWRAMRTAAAAGVSVAPYWRRPLLELLRVEVDRRRKAGDPGVEVWAAFAHALALRVDASGMWAE